MLSGLVGSEMCIRDRSMRMRVQSLALFSGLRNWCCHELWRRSAATALIQPLAWEPPYAASAALKRQKKKKKKKSDHGIIWLIKSLHSHRAQSPYNCLQDLAPPGPADLTELMFPSYPRLRDLCVLPQTAGLILILGLSPGYHSARRNFPIYMALSAPSSP